VFIINKEEKFIYVDVENDLRSPVARRIREEMNDQSMYKFENFNHTFFSFASNKEIIV
jgi:hypothetical protein